MYQRYKERFGTAGVVVGVIALVFALVTGAYAAGGGLSGKQKKEVEKIAKKYAGKPGAAGPAGTNGTNGTPGAKGENGTNGAPGAPGESVTVGSATNVECPSGGGAKLTNKTGTAKVCNGTTGFTETLPSGKTETGTWGATGPPASFGFFGKGLLAPISFNIPLAAAPPNGNVQINQAGFPTANLTKCEEEGEPEKEACEAKLTVEKEHCPGELNEPAAAGGFLCIFTQVGLSTNLGSISSIFVYPVGATLLLHAVAGPEPPPLSASGTWAVTAE